MATTTETPGWPHTGATVLLPDGAAARRASKRPHGPAIDAATRIARIGMALSAVGLAASAMTIAVLLSTWRIGSNGPRRTTLLAGLRITYPAANLPAVIVLLLALAGLGVGAEVLLGAAREFRGARAFDRALAGAGVAELAGAVVIDDPQPHAFCAGLLRPRVYVTSGAIALLDARALEAVLLHEHHHASRRDPLRLAAGRVVARALFFLPWLGALHGHELSLAELGADERAVTAAPENRSALARAMLSFTDASAGRGGIDPMRIDHLVGECPRLSAPVSLYLAPLIASGLIVTFLAFFGHAADGTASMSLPFFSTEPCVVVLALLAAAGARGIVSRRKVSPRSAS
jgi:Zn-dependent protease with chaperone function